MPAYCPQCCWTGSLLSSKVAIVAPTGLEPVISTLKGWRLNQFAHSAIYAASPLRKTVPCCRHDRVKITPGWTRPTLAFCGVYIFSGSSRIRTCDLLLVRQTLLNQLSYAPEFMCRWVDSNHRLRLMRAAHETSSATSA